VTLSPVQRRWCVFESWIRGLSRRTHFHCADAELVEFPESSFDVVWSIECTEHLFDKPGFFRKAGGWLKPGGRVAICAWLAGDRTDDEAVKRVKDVCEGFLCPSLGTSADYRDWFNQAGLVMEQELDWTARVMQTWEICDRRVKQSGIRHLVRMIDRETTLFLDRFQTILAAYREGSMKYGCFIARKPDLSPRPGFAGRGLG
jgi:tocopherol O-methyltransferase